jgi:HYR domain
MLAVPAVAAIADQLQADADALALDSPHANQVSATQNPGTTVAYDFSAYIKETGNASDNVFPGTVPVSISRSGDWLASSPGTPSSFSFTSYNTAQAGKINITVPCDAAANTQKAMTVVLAAGASSNGQTLDNNSNSITLTYTITASGTKDSSCTPADTTAPTLHLPADITQEATGANGNVVNYTATADDANPAHPTVTCTPASGSTFAIATTTVNCEATDAAGNKATGSFKVTVQDTTPPVISGTPSDITKEATGTNGATVSWTAPTASDTVDGSVSVTCQSDSGLKSGDTFPWGARR